MKLRYSIPTFLLLFPLPAFPDLPPIVLGTGEQRLVSIPGLQKYSIGGDLARAAPVPGTEDSLLIKGVRAGATDLWVWKTGGEAQHRTIRVESWRAPGSPDLWRGLSQLREVEVIPVSKGVLLRGSIRTPTEAAIVEQLLNDHPRHVRSLAQLSGEMTRSEYSALPGLARTVFFKVFLLEIRESEADALGIAWPGRTENAFHITPWSVRNTLDIGLALEALAREQRIRILSKPSLSLRVPGEAELFSGGELPIRNVSPEFADVTWRKHGLTLKLKAETFSGDLIRMDVSAGVSHLDPVAGSEEIPGIRANQLRTQVDARLGTPLLLSGLTQEREAQAGQGLPFLSSIPLIGAIFGTDHSEIERAELLAVLLPLAAPPDAPMDSLDEEIPRGPVPAPRHWIPMSRLEALRRSPDFPWNVFDERAAL